MTKKCRRCNEIKSFDEFSVTSSNKDGYNNTCKTCVVKRNKEYWRTPLGRISQIFAIQTSCSKQRKHPAPEYTRKELFDWAINNGLDHLINQWKNSGYEKDLIPSIDRLDPTQPYHLNNIRLVTWKENNDKAYEDRKSCKHITKQNRKVRQLTLDGKVVREYDSISHAARETKIHRVPINNVCRGVKSTHTAGGYLWEYADI